MDLLEYRDKNAIIKIESEYHDLVESERVSDQNSQQLNEWGDILSISNCSKLLDVTNSREKIQRTII